MNYQNKTLISLDKRYSFHIIAKIKGSVVNWELSSRKGKSQEKKLTVPKIIFSVKPSGEMSKEIPCFIL